MLVYLLHHRTDILEGNPPALVVQDCWLHPRATLGSCLVALALRRLVPPGQVRPVDLVQPLVQRLQGPEGPSRYNLIVGSCARRFQLKLAITIAVDITCLCGDRACSRFASNVILAMSFGAAPRVDRTMSESESVQAPRLFRAREISSCNFYHVMHM